MATLQAPIANQTYTVNGHSYTSGTDGRFTVTDANDILLLGQIGIREYVPPTPIPTTSGDGTLRITCDMG